MFHNEYALREIAKLKQQELEKELQRRCTIENDRKEPKKVSIIHSFISIVK